MASEQGVDNAEFAVASATSYPGHGYDLVCYFDCLHDMGDPVGALRHARETLADDGTVMLVEPFANDSLVENLNPVGRMYYAASTLVCTPSSLDQPVALGLGAQAGQQRLGAIAAAFHEELLTELGPHAANFDAGLECLLAAGTNGDDHDDDPL